jgi:hypothetical protein
LEGRRYVNIGGLREAVGMEEFVNFRWGTDLESWILSQPRLEQNILNTR